MIQQNKMKRQDRSNTNHKSEVSDLFSEGMGVDPGNHHDVGLQIPKIGVMAKNSQKFFNFQRDRSIK